MKQQAALRIASVATVSLASLLAAQPCQPVIVSRLPDGPFYASPSTGFAMTSDRVYAVSTSDFFTYGIDIYDISDPTMPQLIASLDIPDATADSEIRAGDGVLWFAPSFNTSPRALVISASGVLTTSGPPVTPSLGSVQSWQAVDDRMYVKLGSQAGLTIFDTSDPLMPVEGATIPSAQWAGAPGLLVTVEPTPSSSTISLWDVDDAANPALLSATVFPGEYAYSDFTKPPTIVDGDTLFVRRTGAGTVMIDISDPTSPSILGEIPAGVVFAKGAAAYSTSPFDSSPFAGFDLTDRLAPVQSFSVDFAVIPGLTREIVASSGDLILLSNLSAVFGTPPSPELVDLSCTAGVNLNPLPIVIDTIIPDGTNSYLGATLTDVTLLLPASDDPEAPGGMVPLQGAGTTVTMEGTKTTGSIVVNGQNTLAFNGALEAEDVLITTGTWVLDGEATCNHVSVIGGSVRVNGKLVTQDLELLDGSTLTHETEATTEAP